MTSINHETVQIFKEGASAQQKKRQLDKYVTKEEREVANIHEETGP